MRQVFSYAHVLYYLIENARELALPWLKNALQK